MRDYDSNFNSAYYEKSKEESKKLKRLAGDKKYKEHLKFLATAPSGYPSGAFYFTPWRDETRKPYYKRSYRTHSSSYIKKFCNKKIRRCKFLLQRGMKNRYTEFWWEYS